MLSHVSVLPVEFKNDQEKSLDHFNRFRTATFLCESQARSCMLNVISRGIFHIFDDLWWKVIVRLIDIDGIVDNHCLNLLYII